MKLSEVIEFAEEVKKETAEYKVIAEEISKAALEFGPSLHRIMEAVVLGIGKITVTYFEYLTKNGFSRDEAIYLITNMQKKVYEDAKSRSRTPS